MCLANSVKSQLNLSGFERQTFPFIHQSIIRFHKETAEGGCVINSTSRAFQRLISIKPE